MPYTQLFPIDDEGLRSDRPDHEAKWTALTNVTVRDGKLYPRPGLIQCSPIDDTLYPLVERGVPVAIMDIKNPDDTTNRQGYKQINETIRPDASSDIVAGWSDDYQKVDEIVPDGTAISTTTEGSQVQYTFPNLSEDFDLIDCIVIRGMARCTQDAQRSRLSFYYRRSSVNYDMGYVDVGSFKAETGNAWHPFAISVPLNPFNDAKWTSAWINNDLLKLVMEFTDGQTQVGEFLAPDADGDETGFTDATNGGTATYSDFNIRPVDYISGDPEVSNGATASTSGSSQSWTYEDLETTFDTISSISPWIWVEKNNTATPTFRFWFRPTAGDDSVQHTLYTYTHTDLKLNVVFLALRTAVATNPETSLAWTATDIANGEFGVTLDNNHSWTIKGHQLAVVGYGPGAGLHVDTIAVDVYGLDADENADTGVIGINNIWSTTAAHLRLDDEESPTSTDITNSVAVTSPGNQPLDWATLYGQVYLVNGTDATRRYPTSAFKFEALTTNDAAGTGLITGRTVTAFADRILYGWTQDATVYTPERVSYSKIFNGGTHNDDSAGDFDLLDTPGGVVKLAVLSEDICAAYKEVGVYALRRTGVDAAPIVRDVVDFQTGVLGRMTVKTVVNAQGQPVQLFLGFNPSVGYNVFAFDGTNVVPIGDPIRRYLRDDVNHNALRNAFAEVDPDGGTYWLFMAEGTEAFPSGGYYYHIMRNQWRKFDLPFDVSCAGVWALADDTPVIGGSGTLIVGGTSGTLYKAKYGITHDSLNQEIGSTSLAYEKVSEDAGEVGRRRDFFPSTMTTGDILLSGRENPQLQNILNRVHLMYYDRGPCKLQLSVSTNGGATYSTAQTYYIGTSDGGGDYEYLVMDFDGPKIGRRHRIKMLFEPENDDGAGDEVYDIGEIWLEWEPGGTNA